MYLYKLFNEVGFVDIHRSYDSGEVVVSKYSFDKVDYLIQKSIKRHIKRVLLFKDHDKMEGPNVEASNAFDYSKEIEISKTFIEESSIKVWYFFEDKPNTIIIYQVSNQYGNLDTEFN